MKRWLKVAICSLVLGGLLNGCFGSFGATRLLYNFNASVHSNVFVQTLVMWCFTILPAYELFMFADWLIINMIEFFMGSNPIGSNVTFEPAEDGTMTAIAEDGTKLKFTAVDEHRMIVEHDGVVLGEVQFDESRHVTMTNYATADVQAVDLENAPAM